MARPNREDSAAAMADTTRMTKDAAISVVPANEASWEDLQAVLGTRGDPFRCQCQRYKMRPGEAWASFPVEERARRLRMQTDCGHPESETTSGLVAYLDGEPVGWCAVEPRSAYPRPPCRMPQPAPPLNPVPPARRSSNIAGAPAMRDCWR